MYRISYAHSRILALTGIVVSAMLLSTVAYSQNSRLASGKEAPGTPADRRVLEYLDSGYTVLFFRIIADLQQTLSATLSIK